jgi:OPA family sugar phosphate sensor protein UhpC-like MFS transporter
VLKTQMSILKMPAIWVLAVSSALMYVTRYAINSWGILYLQEARGFTLAGGQHADAQHTAAGIIGAIAFGYVSDKWFGARRPPANLLFGLLEVTGLLPVLLRSPTSCRCCASHAACSAWA